MKERGIIFSGPMVRAIRDGRKTQTRRVMKNPPTLMDKVYAKLFRKNFGGRKCPYGIPGDKLYVREAHCLVDGVCWSGLPYRRGPDTTFHTGKVAFYREGFDRCAPRWRPSIHMPKWASRIWLEVVGVRVERVQEISEEDAEAEGTKPLEHIGDDQRVMGCDWTFGERPSSGAFAVLWDSINGKRPGCAWEDDPWVWCIEFKPVECGG